MHARTLLRVWGIFVKRFYLTFFHLIILTIVGTLFEIHVVHKTAVSGQALFFLNSRFLGGRKSFLTTGGGDLVVTCAKLFIFCGLGGYLSQPFYLSLSLIPCPQLHHLNGGLGNMWGSFWNTIFKQVFLTIFYTFGINIIASWQLRHIKTIGKYNLGVFFFSFFVGFFFNYLFIYLFIFGKFINVSGFINLIRGFSFGEINKEKWKNLHISSAFNMWMFIKLNPLFIKIFLIN